jgi:MFS family permease
MRAYRELFAIREVRSMVLILLLTRVAAPMLALSLLLAVVAATGSYASGGLVLTGYAGALAVFVPIASRLVDRAPARRVLLGWLCGNVVAYPAMIVSLYAKAPVGVLIAVAVLLGATTPPAGPVTRGLWPSLVPAQRLQTAYAFDAVLNESLFVGGPLVVSALLLVAPPSVIVAVVGACVLCGVLLLVNVPSVRDRRPADDPEPRDYLGPLAHAQVLILLGIIVCDTFAFGSMMVGVPAAAAHLGSRTLAGVLLSVGSLGAVISGVIYGARPRAKAPGRQLAVFHLAGAILLVLAGQVGVMALFALIILGVGLVGGPRDTLHQVVLGEAAPKRYRIEAFAWLGTFMWVGYAGGTAATGQFVQRAGGETTVAFIAAGCAAAVAAALSLLVRSTTPDAPDPDGAAEPEPDGERAEEAAVGRATDAAN